MMSSHPCTGYVAHPFSKEMVFTLAFHRCDPVLATWGIRSKRKTWLPRSLLSLCTELDGGTKEPVLHAGWREEDSIRQEQRSFLTGCALGNHLDARREVCWLLVTSVQKNREMCQEHHEGTTLPYWLHEPSTEKSGSDLFRNLLLCCFFGEKSAVMKRFCFEAGSVLPGKNTDALFVVVI